MKNKIEKRLRPSRTVGDPLRILVEGWFHIPHSYAIVCCNELLALKMCFPEMKLYIQEEEYYRDSWKDVKKMAYTLQKSNMIQHFEQWKGQDIDLVYRITYPYNLEISKYNRYSNKYIPTVVFYTAEFRTLSVEYFKFNSTFKFVDDSFIKSFLEENSVFYFKTPSEWCWRGMEKYLGDKNEVRNKIITHGVDPRVFYRDSSRRLSLRKDWGYTEENLIFMTGGALTRNKGVPEVLAMVYLLIYRFGQKHTRLILKGTSDLYNSQQFVEMYLDDLIKQNVMTKTESKEMIDKYIKFIPSTVNENSLRHLYNAVDLYVSPYLAEGFNLMVLEAISCETRVLVSKGGATDDFVLDILKNVQGAEEYIYPFDTKEVINDGKVNLDIDLNIMLKRLSEIKFTQERNSNYTRFLRGYLASNYSWEMVAKQMYDYFEMIVDGLTDVYSVGGVNKMVTDDIDIKQAVAEMKKTLNS